MVGGAGIIQMAYSRMDIISAAKNCLRVGKTCPKSCPLLQSENCQDIIFREAIRMYDELKGRTPDDENEQACAEEETQART